MTITIDGFSRGMDVSRPAYASDPRTLAVLTNAHLSRGGDVEQRKAFVSTYAATGTKGLAQLRGQLYAFGGVETRPGGLNAAIAYQALIHPTDVALRDVLSVAEFADKLYVIADFANNDVYHFYDGEIVDEWTDGKASGSFYIVSGTAGATNVISKVKVAGIDILGASVAWVTSHAATATAVAARINLQASGYTAEAIGQQVVIRAPTSAAVYNGQTIELTVGGDVATSLISQLVGGSGSAIAMTPGPAGITFGDKLYSIAKTRLHFSELFDPTTVRPNADGAGYVDLATSGEGADELVGLAPYYSALAIFGKRGIQVWSVDVDDAENKRLQTVPDTGLVGSRAIQPWRDGGLLHLSRRGVKSLQARDSSGRGAVSDASTAIDPLLIPHLNSLTDAVRARAILLTDPEDGRLWCIAGNKVFVYSAFGETQVSGWSIYEPGFTISDVAIANNRLFVRSGDTVYLYGGSANTTYDTSAVTVRLQFLGGGAGATRMKSVEGIDVGVEGTWEIYLLPNYLNPAVAEKLADVTGPTFDLPWHPAVSWSSHFAIELRRAQATKGTVSAIHIHAGQDASR